MTVILKVDSESPEQELVDKAASVIRAGGLVAFPTETVYGLGADAMNEIAVQKIFEAKGRPADNPLIVHVCSREMLHQVAEHLSEPADRLIRRFWPGPLTLVFKRRPAVAPSVSAGLETVAVRMPSNPIALELIIRSATPLAAPSANKSGRPSATDAAHVSSDLGGRVDVILDGGRTDIGIESTVLDMTADPPVVLRPGWITESHLMDVIGPIQSTGRQAELRRSPGTRHRHYSPRARLIITERRSQPAIESICRDALKSSKVGFVGHTQVRIDDENFHPVILLDSARDYGRRLYASFRELDDKGVDVIIVEGINESGEGIAVMDRIRRAASESSLIESSKG